MKEWLQIIYAVLPMFYATSEGRRLREQRRKYRQSKRAESEKQKQRQRKYLRIKRLRRKRDKGKIIAQRYAEELKDINERYKL